MLPTLNNIHCSSWNDTGIASEEPLTQALPRKGASVIDIRFNGYTIHTEIQFASHADAKFVPSLFNISFTLCQSSQRSNLGTTGQAVKSLLYVNQA